MTSDARWLLLAGGLILTGCPPGEALDEDEPPAPEPQEVEVEFIVQNGFRITDGEAVVYIDAFTQMSAFEADDADLILITHVMSDHYGRSRVLASAEASGAIVVGPSAVIADLEGAGIDDQLADFDDLMYGERAPTCSPGCRSTPTSRSTSGRRPPTPTSATASSSGAGRCSSRGT